MRRSRRSVRTAGAKWGRARSGTRAGRTGSTPPWQDVGRGLGPMELDSQGNGSVRRVLGVGAVHGVLHETAVGHHAGAPSHLRGAPRGPDIRLHGLPPRASPSASLAVALVANDCAAIRRSAARADSRGEAGARPHWRPCISPNRPLAAGSASRHGNRTLATTFSPGREVERAKARSGAREVDRPGTPRVEPSLTRPS